MKLITAIELYKKSKLSLDKAAGLCGFSKNAFIEIMNYRGETVFNYSAREIEEELGNIDTVSTMLGDNK
jgi:predicted HTH domain antitoxin